MSDINLLTIVIASGIFILATPHHTKEEIGSWSFLRLSFDLFGSLIFSVGVLLPVLYILLR